MVDARDLARPCRRGPPALPRSRRLRCPSGRGWGSAPQGSAIAARIAAGSTASTEAPALGSFAVAHTRLANRDRADAGHDLAFRQMAVAYHALLARLGLEIGMLCEKLSNLRFDRLGPQRTRAAAQDLCEGTGNGPWLGELDDR